MANERLIQTPEQIYQSQLDTILSKPLTPETTATYADEALSQLADLAGEVVQEYQQITPEVGVSNMRTYEDSAFDYFGLGDIEANLDYISGVAAISHKTDTVIQNAIRHEFVAVPTDAMYRPITPGERSVESKQQIPRLKTTLFILGKEFNVDLEDPEQLRISTGVVTPEMMRQTSYYLVEAPNLQRSFLLCDEEGNVSYIFDTAFLEKNNMSSAGLLELSKSTLDELIEQYPDAGRRLRYSENFVSNMLNAIDDPRTHVDDSAPVTERAVTLELPVTKAPEDVLSTRGLSELLGISARTITNIAAEIEPEKFGAIELYKFGANTTAGYSLEQQAAIKEIANARGYFEQKMPKDHLSLRAFAATYGISRETVTDAFGKLDPEQVGDVHEYRNSNRLSVVGLSPDQQQVLYEKIESAGLFLAPAPEGYLSLKRVAESFGVDFGTVDGAIRSIDTELLGDVGKFRFGNTAANGYSPEQIEQIAVALSARDAFLEQPPEGYVSVEDFRKQHDISAKIVRGILEDTDNEELQTLAYFKFGSTKGIALSPRQQEVIANELRTRGYFDQSAPDDYASFASLSRDLAVGADTIKRAIEQLDPDEFGAIDNYRFKTKLVPGFSVRQQELIKTELYKSGLLAPKAPEGFLSRSGLVKNIGTNMIAATVAIKELETSGDIEAGRLYRFENAPRPYQGFSPTEQDIIKGWLINNGRVVNKQ